MELYKKVLSFEYILKEILSWYYSSTYNVIYRGASTDLQMSNDLSILKALKLLFFVSAAKATNKHRSILLEDIFQSFVAMPYGHVESDIYDYIRGTAGELNFFIITFQKTTAKAGVDINQLNTSISPEVKSEIDKSIAFLKDNYPFLISLPAYELVNLSHAWFSWQSFYDLANQKSVKSHPIPPEVIKREDKIFSLQTY